jgi:hypothetical protein
MVNYIQNELEALEREQKQIDKQAAFLEKNLRGVMESGTVCFACARYMMQTVEQKLSLTKKMFRILLDNLHLTFQNIETLYCFSTKASGHLACSSALKTLLQLGIYVTANLSHHGFSEY